MKIVRRHFEIFYRHPFRWHHVGTSHTIRTVFFGEGFKRPVDVPARVISPRYTCI